MRAMKETYSDGIRGVLGLRFVACRPLFSGTAEGLYFVLGMCDAA